MITIDGTTKHPAPRPPYPAMCGRAGGTGKLPTYLGDVGEGSDVGTALGRNVRCRVSSRRGRGCGCNGSGAGCGRKQRDARVEGCGDLGSGDDLRPGPDRCGRAARVCATTSPGNVDRVPTRRCERRKVTCHHTKETAGVRASNCGATVARWAVGGARRASGTGGDIIRERGGAKQRQRQRQRQKRLRTHRASRRRS